MTFYIILAWAWPTLSIKAQANILRIDLGFLQIAFCGFDVEVARAEGAQREARQIAVIDAMASHLDAMGVNRVETPDGYVTFEKRIRQESVH